MHFLREIRWLKENIVENIAVLLFDNVSMIAEEAVRGLFLFSFLGGF